MRTFNVTSAKLTGSPGASGWAQIHEFTPEDAKKLELRGKLFAVVCTARSEEGLQSVSAGRELLARFHEEYFGKIEQDAFSALKNAVEKVVEEFAESWGEVEIAAASLVGDVVYSAAGGGAQTVIFRDGMLAQILKSERKDVISASGYPKEGDIFILGTSLAFETLSSGVVKAALEGGDVKDAAESLAPITHAREDKGSLGLVFVKFTKEEALPLVKEKGEEIVQEVEREKGTLGFRERAAALLESVIERLPERRIYIKGKEEKEVVQSKRRALTVGVILLAILIVSIGFGINQRREKVIRSRYEERLLRAKHEFEEAVSLTSLDPIRARELFLSSKFIVDKLEEEGVKDPELEELKGNLDQNQGAILGEYTQAPELFIDLSILRDNLKGDDMGASTEKVFILDREGRRVVEIAIDTKRTEIIAGEEQIPSDSISVASYLDRVFVLTEKGLFEVGDKKEEVAEKDWQEALVYAYAANLYLLDKGSSKIYRYPGLEGGGFGSKQEWLAPGIEIDFSQATSIAIDGSLWILTDTGKILKLTRGSPENLKEPGLDLTGARAIYTNEELEYLYILDTRTSSVIVLTKEGEYKAQYFAEEAANYQDLAVSEKERKLILLAKERLYSIELKHL